MDLFECLNNLFTKKKYPAEDELSGKMWMVNRFIGMEPDLTEYAAYLSKYFFTLGNRYYKLLYRLIPQTRAPRIQYMKSKKEFEDEFLDRWSQYFQVGKAQTADYLRILLQKKTKDELYNFVGLDLEKK